MTTFVNSPPITKPPFKHISLQEQRVDFSGNNVLQYGKSIQWVTRPAAKALVYILVAVKLRPRKTWLLGRKSYSYICLCINIWHVMTVSFKLKRFLASCMYNVILQSGSWHTSFRSLNFFPSKESKK